MDTDAPTCQKRKFSEKKAKNVIFNARMARAFGSEKRREQRYYYCLECKAFHVTSKEKYDSKLT